MLQTLFFFWFFGRSVHPPELFVFGGVSFFFFCILCGPHTGRLSLLIFDNVLVPMRFHFFFSHLFKLPAFFCDVFVIAPSQIFVHTYDKVIVTPLNKSSKNMVNSAEPGFKSAKNDLFVLTHCDFLKCTFQG